MADAKQQEKSTSATEATQAAVQKAVDKETEQGYRGTTVDPTPNENYTVAGVTSGKPTPETDQKARAAAVDAVRKAR